MTGMSRAGRGRLSLGTDGEIGAGAGKGDLVSALQSCGSSVPTPGVPECHSHPIPCPGQGNLGLQREQSPCRAGTGRELPLEQAEIPGNIPHFSREARLQQQQWGLSKGQPGFFGKLKDGKWGERFSARSKRKIPVQVMQEVTALLGHGFAC